MNEDVREQAARRHAENAQRFLAIAEGVTDWSAPTPVKEWTARDVVDHLVTWFPGFLAGGSDLTIPAGPAVADDPVGAFRHQSSAVQAILDDPATTRRVFGSTMFGELPLAQVIDQFYSADVLMHRWDLAKASGQDPDLDEDVVKAMQAGMAAMGGALRASGQFGEEQPVGADATTVEKFIAFIGRDPSWEPPR